MRNVSSASPRTGSAGQALHIGASSSAPSSIAALPAAGAEPAVAADPAVITTWNAIAVSTIAGPVATGGAGKANAEAFLWLRLRARGRLQRRRSGSRVSTSCTNGTPRRPKGASPRGCRGRRGPRILMEYFGGQSR